MSITVTQAAFKRVELLLTQNPDQNGLRVFIKGGGCGGYQYGFAYENSAEDGDTVLTENGVSIYVDADSHTLMDGAVVDFIDRVEGSAFEIRNPKAKSTCGCGTSFSCEK